MGYTTIFNGTVQVTPPLNEHEISYLRDFAGSRRMKRTAGPYYANPLDVQRQGSREDEILEHSTPPEGQPGLWCHWEPLENFKRAETGWDSFDDGEYIGWDEGEKFYDSPEWMVYLIDHFLKPGAEASQALVASIRQDPRFVHFTFDHVLNGEIEAQGEDPSDMWRLIVRDNEVFIEEAVVTYADRRAVKERS